MILVVSALLALLAPGCAELESVALQVTPTGVVLDPGASAQFDATVTDPLGRPVSGGTIQWAATGGTITAQGVYTAGDTPGPYQVTATETGSGVSTSAGVSIRDPGASPGVITGITFDWSTHRREAPGSDNWPITWSDDDHQYTSWGDGGGFGGTNSNGRVSLGIARIEGDPNTYVGINRFGGYNPEFSSHIDGKAYGIISINGVLYMYAGPATNVTSFSQFRLYKSTNKSQSWTATNVVFQRSTYNLILPTILNFGKDYAGARDGFVYIYAAAAKNTSSLAIQARGEIYLMRVPIADIENQAAYEFYTSTDPANPMWGASAARQPAFADAAGVSWNTGSVIHVPGINRYVLVTEHTQSGVSNIQMHEAPEPWGPWTQFSRESQWGDVQKTNFYWHFAPKWFRNGGVDFTLVFSGFSENDSWNTVDGSFILSERQP